MVQDLTSLSHLKQLTSDESKIIIIDFYADWCGPCKRIAPEYAHLSNNFTSRNGGPEQNNGASVVFLKCNVDRCRDVAQTFKVTSMPTFIVFQGATEVERFAGADIGRVERAAKNNLAYLSQQRAKAGLGAASRGGAGRTLGSGVSGAAAPQEQQPDPHATGLLNAPARYFLHIAAAKKKGGDSADAEVEKHVRDLVAFLQSQLGGAKAMPLGAQLIPFLVVPESEFGRVPCDPVNTFFETLLRLGAEEKESDLAAAPPAGTVVCKDGVCSIVPPTEGLGLQTESAVGKTPIHFGSATTANKDNNDNNISWAFVDKVSLAEVATTIITNLVRIAVNALTFETWHVVGAGGITAHTLPSPNEAQMQRLMNQHNNNNNNNGKPPPPPPYAGRWHTMLGRLVRCDAVLKVLFSPGKLNNNHSSSVIKTIFDNATPSPLICSRWMKTGKQLELNTLLGSLLSVGFFPSRASLQQQQIQILAMLHPSGLTGQALDVRAVKAEVENNEYAFTSQVHNEMDAHVARCFPIFRELIGKKGPVRTGVLQWLHAFFAANAGFTRQNKEKSELCAETSMLTLANILVELALPITGSAGFEKTIPTDYYHDLNAFCVGLPEDVSVVGGSEAEHASLAPRLLTMLNTRAVVHFGLNRLDVERVRHFKPLKDETLNSLDEVEVLMAVAQSTDCEGRAHENKRTSNSDENDNDTAAVSATAVDDDDNSFPLPFIDPTVGPAPMIGGATGTVNFSAAIASPTSVGSNTPTTLVGALATRGVNYYAPRVHIFFMALRAVSLTTTVTLSTITSLEQQMHHPRTSARDAGFYKALIATHKAMITNGTHARKTVQFLNGVARWLLHILEVDRETGALGNGGVPSKAWDLLPQQIVDEVLTAITLVTKHNVSSLHPSDVDDIISLLLVLMGNLTYFPKAHTHALFPTVLLELLNSKLFAPSLTRHRWFQSNIVLGCIRTYIAMEKCYYEKTNCRYYLSVCLKRFLNEDVLCYSARQTLLNKMDRTLEKFTHMVTTEANQAIDDALTALAQMRKLEADGKDNVDDGSQHNASTFNANANTNNNNNNRGGGARRRGNNSNRRRNNGGSIYSDSDAEESGNDDNANNESIASETYPQLGEKLKNGLLIFSETIVVFKLLSRQFQAGVLQHMVSQQIANMLVQNISKLAGKNSAELKVKNPETWGFNPRALLDNFVECFVHFRREPIFIACVLESIYSVSTPEAFAYSVTNITNPNRTLVVPFLASELREMKAALDAANIGRDLEEKIWDDDAPEWAFCALLSTPLKDPVALPMPRGGASSPDDDATTAEDFIFVERDVIRHRLLELEENPFSREKLNEKQLNDHNEIPSVKKAVMDLKARIAAYAAQRRKELLAAANTHE